MAEQSVAPLGGAAERERPQTITRRSRPVQRAIGRADRTRPIRLSAGQQQMWVLHQLDPASPAYVMTWALRLSGSLDTEALRQAWEQVVERHEILRTRYAQVGDEPVQIIDPPKPFALHFVDLGHVPLSAHEERVRQIAEWEARRPFDLTTEHSLRVTLIALAADLHVLVIHLHHIAGDALSYQHLAAELGTVYTARVDHRPPGLPDVTVQYADYAAWELAGSQDGSLRPHLEYWSRTLSGLQELPLPLDRPRQALADWRGGTVDVVFEADAADGVRALASAHRASLAMVLLAAYQALLAGISQAEDVAVGLPVSARTRPELDELIGYTINSIVVRAQHHEGDTFAQLLAQVRERFLDAFDHRAAPFKWVVDEADVVRGTTRNPLFQVCFNVNASAEDTLRLPGLVVEPLPLTGTRPAKFDLTLHVQEAADRRLFTQFEFATEVIDEDTARGWAGYFGELLEAVVRDPQESLAKLHDRLRERWCRPAQDGVDTASRAMAPTLVSDDARALLLDRIRHVWCDVLGLEGADDRDNFFDVGGHSLRAIEMAGRLQAEGLDVSSADVFAHQTIEELADLCAAARAGHADLAEAAPPSPVEPYALLSREDRDALPPGLVDAYPMTAMQLGMLAEMRSRPDVNTYQDTTSYRVRANGDFDAAALQQAAQLVVDRHEVLRTSFDLNSYSVPLQLVHAEAPITVGLTEHGLLGAEGWDPRVRAHAVVERQFLMDISTAPLIRLHAHTAKDSADWWLTIAECHPILEGWSFHSMLMEILVAYEDIRAGRVAAEPEAAPFRFADYVAAELATVRSTEHRAYWRAAVEGLSDVALPTAWQDRAESPRERYFTTLDFQDLEADLRRLASETRTSMKAVLLAAHMKIMSMIAGEERFFTGLVCDTRPEVPGANRVLGNYLNTVPFAMPVGARTWGALVTAVYHGLTDLWPHRGLPIHIIQRECGQGSRLLEVFFNYLDFHQVDKNLVDWAQTFNDSENEFALHVYTISGHLRLNTTSHSLGREAGQRLAALYRSVLEEMARGPEGDTDWVCRPPLETGRAHSLAVAARDRGGVERTVPEAFAALVREHPDAVAVLRGAESLTYAQLDAWAERIAGRLRQSGVAAGDLVAVVPRHDTGTLAALLAVWKAGAAFAPWEPAGGGDDMPGPGWSSALSAVIVPSAGDAEGAALGRVPVLVSRDGKEGLGGEDPLGTLPHTAGREAPRLSVDTACVVRTAGNADAGWAVFSHQALAHGLSSARAGLEARGISALAGSAWLSMTALPAWCALNELLLPIMCAGSAVLTASSLPDAVAEIRDLVTAGTVTHMRTTTLAAEHVFPDGSAAAGVTALADSLCDGDGQDDGRRTASSSLSVRLIPADSVDTLPGWLTLHGRPLPGRTLRVLDTRLRPVPLGVVGELCVGGAGLADALFGDPAGTAEAFIPDPFGTPGARLFRTGLLARFAADGTLEYVGPIERSTHHDETPAEVYRTRDLLDALPSVRDSRVLLRPDSELGRPRTIGYVRVAPGARFAADELSRSLAERGMPRHLIPETLVKVEGWPLAACGGVALDRLPEPEPVEDVTAVPGTPWDEQFEELIQEALSSVYSDPSATAVTPDLPLSDAGLTSLAMVRLLVSLENAYDITIPDEVVLLDAFRTPRTLWEEISQLRKQVLSVPEE
ncbi:condensation domain-containing protein [Streptomyces sp. NPDC001137]|uniref:condensation domain-containing protein n=1 Tax=Streptomyces sp. NPDC001137 TaxID=3154378 RepID=UPI00332C7AE5